MNPLLVIFITVFFAELGDKTQIATLLFTAKAQAHPVWVFAAAAGALVASTACAVLLGAAAEAYLTRIPLNLIAGVGLVVVGVWTIWGYFAAS